MNKKTKQEIIELISAHTYGFERDVALAVMGKYALTRYMLNNYFSTNRGEIVSPFKFLADGVVIPMKPSAKNLDFKSIVNKLGHIFGSYAYLPAKEYLRNISETDAVLLVYNEPLREHSRRVMRFKVVRIDFYEKETRCVLVRLNNGAVLKVSATTPARYRADNPHYDIIANACVDWFNGKGDPKLSDWELVHDANKALSQFDFTKVLN